MIRSATATDRPTLAAMLDRSFGKTEANWFLNRYPHLFTDAAIAQHSLVVEDDAILGCVGCYGFDALLHAAPLRIAGVGQVATVPEARGRGLMTGLLESAIRSVGETDLFWLYGDRQRYGRVGFAPGGLRADARTFNRYALPVPAGPPIRALDLAADDAVIAAMLAARPLSVVMSPAQRLIMLQGKRAGGWTDGSAAVLLGDDGRKLWAAIGEDAAVARLAAHQVAQREARDPADASLIIQADPDDLPLQRLIRRLAGGVGSAPSCMLRVGRLLPVMAAWAAAHPPVPGARLRPSVLDGGAAGRVRVSCEGGAYVVTASVEPADLTLSGAALAEVVFGLVPPALSGLPADSALRQLLPLHFNVPECYGL